MKVEGGTFLYQKGNDAAPTHLSPENFRLLRAKRYYPKPKNVFFCNVELGCVTTNAPNCARVIFHSFVTDNTF